ncbi:MAG: hypothetical protein II802_01270 [Clostridia bacterium]|nr:hypothetical protein [Clostridia bacterium]
MIEKLENAVKIYSQMAFVPVKTFESVYAFETTEHYRKPPAEDYKLINSGKKMGRRI